MFGFIPLPHKVIVSDGEFVDEWAVSNALGKGIEVAARVSYNTSRESIALSSGEEIIFAATIHLEGLPNVNYESFIRWQDDYGTEHKSKPLDIKHKRDLSGAPVSLRVLV